MEASTFQIQEADSFGCFVCSCLLGFIPEPCFPERFLETRSNPREDCRTTARRERRAHPASRSISRTPHENRALFESTRLFPPISIHISIYSYVCICIVLSMHASIYLSIYLPIMYAYTHVYMEVWEQKQRQAPQPRASWPPC